MGLQLLRDEPEGGVTPHGRLLGQKLYFNDMTGTLLKVAPKNLQQLFEEKQKTFKHHWQELKDRQVQQPLPPEGKGTAA